MCWLSHGVSRTRVRLGHQPFPNLQNLILHKAGPPALSLQGDHLSMLASTITPACLRAKIILLLALSLVWSSSAVFAQDSVMIRFSPSGLDHDVINRGDFNNDGIPDIVPGNNAGNNGNSDGLSVYPG